VIVKKHDIIVLGAGLGLMLYGIFHIIVTTVFRVQGEAVWNAAMAFLDNPAFKVGEFLQFTYCIKCGICLSACPTFASDSKILGPQALSQAYRYCADNRDEGEEHRLRIVENDHGLWNCHFAAACSDACPKGVDPALAIQLLRRKVLAKALNINQKKEAAVIVPPPTTYKPEITVPEFTAKLSDKD